MNEMTYQLTSNRVTWRQLVRISRIVCVATAIIFALMALLLLLESQPLTNEEQNIVRQVDIALPPPPPPPPAQTQQQTAPPALNLDIAGEGAQVQVSQLAISGGEPVFDIDIPTPQTTPSDWDSLLTPNWQTFGLDQLDSTPRLLTRLKINYPPALINRGIFKVSVDVDVVIEQTGRVILRQVMGTPPPEILPELKRLIGGTRFSAPQKDGKPVSASFIWPLEFSQ